jgi:hypothetical protein
MDEFRIPNSIDPLEPNNFKEKLKFRKLLSLQTTLNSSHSLKIDTEKTDLDTISRKESNSARISTEISSRYDFDLIRSRKDSRISHRSRFLIPSSSIILKSFKVQMILLSCYSVIVSLYYLAFFDISSTLHTTDDVVTAFFCLELLSKFFQEKVTKTGKHLILQKEIIKNYLKSDFFIDFIALFPFGLFVDPYYEYLARLTRVRNMKGFFRIINMNKWAGRISLFIHGGESYSKKQFQLYLKYLTSIFKKIILMAFVTYLLACLWFFYIRKVYEYNPNNESFFQLKHLNQQSKTDIFIKCWYFMFTTLATVGYGDIVARNKYEMGLLTFVVILGTAWFSYILASSIQKINKINDLNNISSKRLELFLWLSSIEKNSGKLSPCLKKRIITHFNYSWKHDRIGSFDHLSYSTTIDISTTNDRFFNLLPLNIKNQLLEIFVSDFIYSFIRFFRYFGEEKYKITLFFQPRFFSKGEFLLEFNKNPNEIIFVRNGIISIGIIEGGQSKLQDEKNWIELTWFSNPFIVGEYAALKHLRSFLAFRAKSDIQGYSLSTKLFLKFIKRHKIQLEHYLNEVEQNYMPLIVESKYILNIELSSSQFLKKFLIPSKNSSYIYKGLLRTNVIFSVLQKNKKDLTEDFFESQKKIEEFLDRREKLLKKIRKKSLICLSRVNKMMSH